jgi:peroxiredoxin
MSEAAPPDPSGAAASGPGGTPAPELRKPRKRFILVGLGIGVLIVVLIGLFTSIGTTQNSTGAPHVGGPVPSFTAANVGPVGPKEVSVPANGGSGAPTVLVFFGAWCTSCSQELPPLTAVVRRQYDGGGGLSKIRVIGIDSFDSESTAKAFIQEMGMRFPVAADPSAEITSGLFYFKGDPYTVFVSGDGTISRIVIGAQLTPASFTADERALIPSGT